MHQDAVGLVTNVHVGMYIMLCIDHSWEIYFKRKKIVMVLQQEEMKNTRENIIF